MSRLYDNIKALCKYRSVLMSDIEKPLNAGTISRYERRGTIMNLPIGLVYRASKMLDVPIEKLLETDIANEIWGEKMSNEIYGIFKKSELSDELVEDLHKQVDLILEYAKKKRTEQTEPNSSEKPNNCEEPQYEMGMGTLKCDNCSEYGSFKCTKCDGEMYFKRLEPNDEPQNYCDDCLYTDTCDSKAFFYACTSKATISKMEQVGKERSE